MRPSRTLLLATLLVALHAPAAGADPIFASPPHVVAGRDGTRIVLFLNEPVTGALAARAGDDFEVRVPRSEVAPAIQGQDFGADGWGNGGEAVQHLVLAAGAKGDTTIRIRPSGAVHGVDARAVDDPPRLIIDLLAAAATKTPAPTATPKPTRTPAGAKAGALTSAPKTSGAKAATATPRPPRATATTAAPATPAPTTTSAAAAHEPIAVAAAEGDARTHDPSSSDRDRHEPPSAETLARATVLTARTTNAGHAVEEELPHAAAAPAPAPPPSPAARAPAAADAAVPRAITAPARPVSGTAAPTFGLRCLWRRFGGIALCVADPKAAPYAGDHTITALVGALARGKLPEPEDTPTIVTPAATFLAADVLFATRAPEGKLLPVVDAYRRALRTHPDFPEAWRARLNIALAYRAMEFLAEIHTVAGEAAIDPTGGLVRGFAGDLAFVSGKTATAVDDYRRAGDMGGLGACLAARGRARLALADGNAATAAAELAALGSLCPPEIAGDAETLWVRGRLALAEGDLGAARTLLEEAERGLGTLDRGGVLVDVGAVAEAANDPTGARRTYERLTGGACGARAARQATVRLALLDGIGGDVSAGLKRLDRLTPEASDPARRALVMHSARGALGRGAVGEALAILHDAHVDPTQLGVDDQLLVAEAYRRIGLYGEAERILSAAQAAAGTAAPDALFAARGGLALGRRDGAGALAVGDEWIRVRGRSGGALGLRARALALGGDGAAARAAVAAAVIEDGTLARPLSLAVAELLRDRAPSVALALARQALEPGATVELPPARHAAGLALVGALAEDAGDDDTALAAFTTLAARYGKEPVAADAAYRAARLAARRVPGGDAAAFDEAVRAKDPLARRVAGAAREYEAIMKPLGGAQEER